MSTMTYGNTTAELKRSMIVGLIIGLITYAFSALMLLFVEHVPAERLIPLTFIVVVPAFAIGSAVASTVIFRIRIYDNTIEQRLFDRFVLSRANVFDYMEMKQPSPPFAAILKFQNGKNIRIWGMHLGILSQLDKDLKLMANNKPNNKAIDAQD